MSEIALIFTKQCWLRLKTDLLFLGLHKKQGFDTTATAEVSFPAGARSHTSNCFPGTRGTIETSSGTCSRLGSQAGAFTQKAAENGKAVAGREGRTHSWQNAPAVCVSACEG